MKIQRLGGALLLLSVIIGAAVICWPTLYPPQPAPTRENFSRLNIGMEQDDVLAILGPATHREEFRAHWDTDHCKIRVLFCGLTGDTGDKRATVGTLTTSAGETLKLQPRAPGILETVRGWLGF